MIRGTYPYGEQYMAFPGTKEGRNDLDTSALRRAGAGSWQMVNFPALLLIKTCVGEDRKLRIKRNSSISDVTFKICLKIHRSLKKE